MTSSIEKLKKMAYVDELTGAFNRRGFKMYAEKIFKEASLKKKVRERRKFSITDVSLIFIDLDHFKRVNDRYGHSAGDDALQHVAHLLVKRLRAFDLIGRWGGEEFVVLLVGAKESSAVQVAEDTRRMIEDSPLRFDKKYIYLTASVGVRSFKKEKTLDEMIHSADQAMYRAKKAGRNCVRVAK